MKRSIQLVIVLMFAAMTSVAQRDTINITLSAKHHAYIIALIPKDANVEKQRYINQVADALSVDDSTHIIIDSSQAITVNVTTDLVREMYLGIGNQPERLTTNYNAAIKAALIPQLFRKLSLLQAIQVIAIKNAAETEDIIRFGFSYLKALKL